MTRTHEIQQRFALIARVDYDFDNPYYLAMKLLALGPRPFFIRTSAIKGTHLAIVCNSESELDFIRQILDDPARVHFDKTREERGLSGKTDNVLWDIKDGKKSGKWIESTTDSFGNWLLQSGYRSIRTAIENLTEGRA